MDDNPDALSDVITAFVEIWPMAAIIVVNRIKAAWFSLLVLLGLGVELVVYRALFLRSIPHMLHHLGLVTAIIDTLIFVFTTMEDAVILIVAAVKDFIHMFERSKPKPHFKLHKYKLLSTDQIQQALTQTGATCSDYNTMPKIMSFITRQTFSPYVCPVIRATEPTILYKVTNDTLGWMSYSSEMYNSDSCRSPPDDNYMWICCGVGSGFVILEVILPLYVLVLTLPTLLSAVLHSLKLVYSGVSIVAKSHGKRYQ